MIGEKGAKLQATVWKEIMETLKGDIPEVERLVHDQPSARL